MKATKKRAPRTSRALSRVSGELPLLPLTEGFAEAGIDAHVKTLLRWAIRGCRGVKLETVRLGSSVMTSRQAVSRFLSALSRGEE